MPIIAVVSTDGKKGRAIILGFTKDDLSRLQDRQVCTKEVGKFFGIEDLSMTLLAAESEEELVKRFEQGTGITTMPMSTNDLSMDEITGIIKSEKN